VQAQSPGEQVLQPPIGRTTTHLCCMLHNNQEGVILYALFVSCVILVWQHIAYLNLSVLLCWLNLLPFTHGSCGAHHPPSIHSLQLTPLHHHKVAGWPASLLDLIDIAYSIVSSYIMTRTHGNNTCPPPYIHAIHAQHLTGLQQQAACKMDATSHCILVLLPLLNSFHSLLQPHISSIYYPTLISFHPPP
jgi:hypothetical protein